MTTELPPAPAPVRSPTAPAYELTGFAKLMLGVAMICALVWAIVAGGTATILWRSRVEGEREIVRAHYRAAAEIEYQKTLDASKAK